MNSLKKVKVSTFASTVNDEGVEDITYDYVTLPSLSQMYIKPQTSGEGEVHTYWRRRSGRTTPCEYNKEYTNMIEYSVNSQTTPQNVRLRSTHRTSTCYTWYVRNNGSIEYFSASNSYAFAPLVCIA